MSSCQKILKPAAIELHSKTSRRWMWWHLAWCFPSVQRCWSLLANVHKLWWGYWKWSHLVDSPERSTTPVATVDTCRFEKWLSILDKIARIWRGFRSDHIFYGGVLYFIHPHLSHELISALTVKIFGRRPCWLIVAKSSQLCCHWAETSQALMAALKLMTSKRISSDSIWSNKLNASCHSTPHELMTAL